LTSKRFVQEEQESNYDVLERFLKQTGSITKEQYLKLVEQRGIEPDITKMPLDMEDLDPDLQIAFSIYYKLGNRVDGNVGFVGKDYTNLPIFMEVYSIFDKLYLLDLLVAIEVHYIRENQKAVEKMFKDSKKKVT
jgi:hypothetical protein